jgi:hypothetical protein
MVVMVQKRMGDDTAYARDLRDSYEFRNRVICNFIICAMTFGLIYIPATDPHFMSNLFFWILIFLAFVVILCLCCSVEPLPEENGLLSGFVKVEQIPQI